MTPPLFCKYCNYTFHFKVYFKIHNLIHKLLRLTKRGKNNE